MFLNYIKKNKIDILLLTLLAFVSALVLYPLTWTERHFEMYLVLRYLPDSLSGLLLSIFERWPTGIQGWNYRPLQLSIMPYIYFHLFQWNHHYWLAANLVFPCLIILLTYVLVKIISLSRVAAFFSALFLFSYYIQIFSYATVIQYDPECMYIPLYLITLILFVLDIKKKKAKNTLLAVIFFVLALMSKEVAATLPIMLVIIVFLFRLELVKEAYKKTKAINITVIMSPKTYLNLIKDRESLFGRLLPFVAIWSVYILLRIVIPLINGIFDVASSRAHTLTGNFSVIGRNLHSFIMSLLQTRGIFLGKCTYFLIEGDLFIIKRILFLLFAISLILFVIKIIRVNKIMLFGLSLYLVQAVVYILMNSQHSLHHLMPSLIGPAIIFGEAIKIFFRKLGKLSLGGKYVKQSILSGMLGILTVIFIINAYAGAKDYFENYAIWPNKVCSGIEEALPKPENRVSNTFVYVKGFGTNKIKNRDYYLEVIKPAYYGKKNIFMLHESQINDNEERLLQMKAQDYTIIVLEHIDFYTTVNVTNESNAAEVWKYMSDYKPCQEELTNIDAIKWHPIQWHYLQTGEGRGIERVRGLPGDEVFKGNNSVKINPPLYGDSSLTYLLTGTGQSKNPLIRFVVWVKSDNFTQDAVQIEIQDGVGLPAVTSYSNSGDWEKVEVEKRVDPKSKQVLLVLRVSNTASAPVYFDHVELDTLAVSSNLAENKLINPSFETWFTTPSGGLLPDSFYDWRQGPGGSVEKYTFPDGVKDGNISVELKPCVNGKFYIRQRFQQIEGMRGRRVRFSAWVKSANLTPDAVQIDIQDIASPVTVTSYNNSGDWELVEVEKRISLQAEQVLLTLSVDSTTSARAYFDNLRLKVLPELAVNNNSFELWGCKQEKK